MTFNYSDTEPVHVQHMFMVGMVLRQRLQCSIFIARLLYATFVLKSPHPGVKTVKNGVDDLTDGI